MTNATNPRTPVGTLTPVGASGISHLMGMGMGMGPPPPPETPHPYRSPTHIVYGNPLIDRREWRHTVLLVDFMMNSKWQDKTEGIKIEDPPDDDSDITRTELEDLRIKRDHESRRQRMNEIVAEITEYMGLYENLCYFDAISHPHTVLILQTMDLISWTLVSYYKEKYARPRPTELDPSIRPTIRVPDFAAYPSGHSTQVNLSNLALQEMIGEDLLDRESVSRPTTTLRGELDRVTKRVAENREWAGVHYKSDTDSGKQLAQGIWDLVRTLEAFETLIGVAQLEWKTDPGDLGARYRMIRHGPSWPQPARKSV